jgi:hypothetical protein
MNEEPPIGPVQEQGIEKTFMASLPALARRHRLVSAHAVTFEIGEDLRAAIGLAVPLGLHPIAHRVLMLIQVVRERLHLG